MKVTIAATLVAAFLAAVAPAPAAAQSAHGRYTSALARERALRDAASRPTLTQIRAVVAAYEQIVRRYPSSGYTDNALWQGANLALLAHERFGDAVDRRTAVRLLKQLQSGYPSSSLVPRARQMLVRLEAPVAPAVPAAARAAAAPARLEAPAAVATRPAELVTIRDIKRTTLPDGVRVTIEMDGESIYRQERLHNPARVFFDLRGARTVAALQDATLRFEDDVVREIRLGRHPQNTTRIVMDMSEVDSYSVFTLYNPFRLVVDFRRVGVAAVATSGEGLRLKPDAIGLVPVKPDAFGEGAPMPHTAGEPATAAAAAIIEAEKLPLARRPATAPLPVPPIVPRANSNGRFSLSRQLGLGISRIVLDPGHGGHDPGARANGLSEAELVLDVALRLRKLLEEQTAIEVAMTREKDVFVPLEERTAFANRQGADLFLSIHANASTNLRARGVETYFLNFASNPEAEAVAARENSASSRTMHSLPDIVRAIATNNKINESRDFASMVQKAMVLKLSARNNQLRDLGVKQAPFVVLIGAGMPSVLAEISFITNKQEGALLKTGAYRQQIAEALLDAVLRYQQSLKNVRKVAARQP